MENKYKETESMIFFKKISDQYLKDKNEKNLRDNILKYKEIRSKEEIQKEIQKERDDNNLGIEDLGI